MDIDLKRHKFVDVQTIYHKKEPRTLSAAYKFYCGEELNNAHSADADTRATYEVLKAQLERYPDLENNIDYLSEFSMQEKFVDFAGRIIYDKNNVEIFNFGKYKGQAVVDVFRRDPSYYSWIMEGDFSLYLKKVVTQIRVGIKTK